MMNRKTKDVYVYVTSYIDGLEFEVRFDDNCQKRYRFNRYEVAALRCSDRDFIEAQIRYYYDSIDQPVVELNIHFS
jgi:hypothetical protein